MKCFIIFHDTIIPSNKPFEFIDSFEDHLRFTKEFLLSVIKTTIIFFYGLLNRDKSNWDLNIKRRFNNSYVNVMYPSVLGMGKGQKEIQLT